MESIALKRQLITDATGKAIGVILPLEEYTLVKAILEDNFSDSSVEDDQVPSNHDVGASSIREAAFFGMWADHPDLQEQSSRSWLEELRQRQWDRS